MTLSFRHWGLGGILMLSAGCSAEPAIDFATSADQTGCLLEHIAVTPGTNQYQYDSLSPDGGKIAIGWDRGEEERGTYVLDLKTGERKDLPGMNNGAVFAPDGRAFINAIYVEGGKTDIAEYDPATDEMTIIAPHEAWDWLASYNSTGDEILFNSFRSGNSEVYVWRKSDAELMQWTDLGGYSAHAQFSPDDSKILFHYLEPEGQDDFNLFVIDTAMGDPLQLTHETTEESYGSWSPDGGTIVFASDRDQASGESDIYLMDADGDNVRRLTDNAAKDGYPFFSPDGKHVYFTSFREPQGVYRIAFESGLDCVKGAAIEDL